MNNEILFKPNSLILATSNTNDITSSEYKLFDTLLQRCQYNNGYGWRKAELKREEIKEIIKANDYSTVKAIINTLDKFRSINMKFKIGSKLVSGDAISEYTYDENTGVFSCSISENVFNVLMNYSKYGYSPIDLQIVRKAKSYYTQKIYGILRMWSRYKEVVNKTYTLEQIKEVCDISGLTSYDNYKEFKRRVLNPVIKEINEKLNMEVEYKEVKCGRKVHSIEFIFTDHEPRKYKFEDKQIIEPKEIIEEIKVEEKNDTIDSIDYMNMIDCNINESIHSKFISDFEDYKNYFVAVKTAAEKTLGAIGGKTINKRNYKYFKTCLENLI